MVKLQNNKGQFKLTIPKDIIKLTGWKGGTEIVLIQNQDGNLILKEIKGVKHEKRGKS